MECDFRGYYIDFGPVFLVYRLIFIAKNCQENSDRLNFPGEGGLHHRQKILASARVLLG